MQQAVIPGFASSPTQANGRFRNAIDGRLARCGTGAGRNSVIITSTEVKLGRHTLAFA